MRKRRKEAPREAGARALARALRLCEAGRAEAAAVSVLRVARGLPRGLQPRALAILGAAFRDLGLAALARFHDRRALGEARSRAARREVASVRARGGLVPAGRGPRAPRGGAETTEFVENFLTSVLQDLYGNASAVDRAIESYEKLDRMYPGHVRIHRRLDELRLRAAQLAGAEQPGRIAGGQEGLLTEFVQGLGQAAPGPSAAIVVNPPSPDTSEQRYRKLKQSLREAAGGRPDRFLSDFHGAVSAAIAASDYETHYNMGLAYRDMGLLSGAVEWFRKSQSSPSRHLQATFGLATCLVEQGETAQAQAELERALTRRGQPPPEYLEIKYLLADLYGRSERRDGAAALYREICEVSPSFRDAAARLASLG